MQPSAARRRPTAWAWMVVTVCLGAQAVSAQGASSGGWPPSEPSARSSAKLDTQGGKVQAIDNPWKEDWDRLLLRPVSCQFDNYPLDQCIDELARRNGFEYHIDQRSLEDAGVETDVPVTLHLTNVSLRTVFNLLLKQVDLGWSTRDQVLCIADRATLSEDLPIRVYPVGDLVNLEPTYTYFDPLIEAIVSTIAPTTWDEVGGAGTIQQYDNVLVIAQTDEVHRQIEDLLAALRATVRPRSVSRVPPAEMSRPAARPTSGWHRRTDRGAARAPLRAKPYNAAQLESLFPGARVNYSLRN